MNSFDFLNSLLSTIPEESQNVSFIGFAIIMLASIVFSVACAYLYLVFFDPNSTGSKVYRAFPLIGPAITCIFITVQFSLPLSLGLLGALSIVRFRTPIKEPEEIGFILLLIACSLSIATFNILFTVILYASAAATLFVLRQFKLLNSSHSRIDMLHIEIPSNDADSNLINQVTNFVDGLKIKANVMSIHQSDEQIHLTYSTKIQSRTSSETITKIKNEFPGAIVDYHQA